MTSKRLLIAAILLAVILTASLAIGPTVVEAKRGNGSNHNGKHFGTFTFHANGTLQNMSGAMFPISMNASGLATAKGQNMNLRHMNGTINFNGTNFAITKGNAEVKLKDGKMLFEIQGNGTSKIEIEMKGKVDGITPNNFKGSFMVAIQKGEVNVQEDQEEIEFKVKSINGTLTTNFP